MGLFGIGEILISSEMAFKETQIQESKITSFFPRKKELRISATSILRGTGVGFFLGLIPGMNSVIPTFISYALEKKVSKHSEKFGTGVIEGVAAPETANNAFANAALIPLFTLGIPSSPTVAILMGALIMNGLIPGPLLFTQHGTFTWGVIASLCIGNLILLILNLPLAGWWAKLLKIPYPTLVVMILIFCIVGAYSLANSVFDIGVMLMCGILGYVFKKLDFPLAPAILTLVLGPMMERSLREAISISRGDYSVFFTRPISLFFLILTALVLLISFLRKVLPTSMREEGKGAEI
jgi:putative tricarboxylic transport membrane protein